jgi:hypothetical protein
MSEQNSEVEAVDRIDSRVEVSHENFVVEEELEVSL